MENQFQTYQNWTSEVLDAIKKDLKNDYLPKDPVFHKTNFGNRPINRLTSEEINSAFEKELLAGNDDLAEFVVNRWVFKHGDLYSHFATRLSEINPDFTEIKTLSLEETEKVLEGALEQFGAIPTFLFTVLNGVVFPKSAIEELQKAATIEKAKLEKEQIEREEKQSLDKILATHAREIARLQDKIVGVQKKYTTDTESLKKQIKALQKRLNG